MALVNLRPEVLEVPKVTSRSQTDLLKTIDTLTVTGPDNQRQNHSTPLGYDDPATSTPTPPTPTVIQSPTPTPGRLIVPAQATQPTQFLLLLQPKVRFGSVR